MAVAKSHNNLSDILFVMVTCTRDESRAKALEKLVSSINAEHRRHSLFNDILVFDNASTTISPLKDLKVESKFALCEKNIGYWSALHWVTNNYKRIFGKDFKYIHPIESDLVMYGIENILDAEAFLDSNRNYTTVRTQEFIISQKKRFFKNSGTLFPVRRSRVAPYHGVTGETITIDKTDSVNFPNIYTSEWHAKVPALHRLSVFRDVMNQLAKETNVTESMFMEEMYKRSKRVGILDKGIYYCNLGTRFWPWEKKWLTGSWSDEQTLKKHGYLPSRHAEMTTSFPNIEILENLP